MVTPPYTPTCDSPGPSVASGVVPSLVVCVLRRAPCGVVWCGGGFWVSPPLPPVVWCGVRWWWWWWVVWWWVWVV